MGNPMNDLRHQTSSLRLLVLGVLVSSTVFATQEFSTIPTPEKLEKQPELYSPYGKRDPFRPNALLSGKREIAQEIDSYPLEQYTLKAILHAHHDATASFVSPSGQTVDLQVGDVLGREEAILSRILTSEVIFTVRSYNDVKEETLYEKIIYLPQ